MLLVVYKLHNIVNLCIIALRHCVISVSAVLARDEFPVFMPTTEELAERTGLVPGCVPPFGQPILPFPLYAAPACAENERIAFNAGSLEHSIVMSARDWVELAQPVLLRGTASRKDDPLLPRPRRKPRR